ncbi:MAG TPA: glucuronate isomerase [Flavobacteriaceae bacterium]|nr:glucuronate isomerase [Flavobacteriaceae bacterium]
MKNFIDDNFLLGTKYAQELYHDYAKNQPIIDYHNHLPSTEIANNRKFENLTKLWLDGDHYKWRAMRNLGIEEKFITGKSSYKEKFDKWAYTIPYTMRNPLYHWSHLELKRYFEIDESLNPESANKIYNLCNEKLNSPEFSSQGLLEKMNVEVICTTDDPLDDLTNHKKILNSASSIQVFPTFRPDSIINLEKIDFVDYINTLSKISKIDISDFESLLEAIKTRINYFHDYGCRLSDHGLPYAYGEDFTRKEIDLIFEKRITEKNISITEKLKFKSAILYYLGNFYAEKGWTMQLHLGPIRDTNKALLAKIGINAGVDSIGDFLQAEQLAKLLNRLNDKGRLPKTILYNSNPSDNDVFATMAGNFGEDGIKGKVQFGAAWWFLDQKEGIMNQINSLSNMGLLSSSLGMLTDSRSFLSFPRHEYYRRVLCNLFGNDIKNGELPNDIAWIGKLVSDICYNNAKSYFGFPKLKREKVN